MEDEMITIRQAAKVLNVSEGHAYRMVAREQIPVERNPLFRKHARVKVKLSEVLSLLPSAEREAARARLG